MQTSTEKFYVDIAPKHKTHAAERRIFLNFIVMPREKQKLG